MSIATLLLLILCLPLLAHGFVNHYNAANVIHRPLLAAASDLDDDDVPAANNPSIDRRSALLSTVVTAFSVNAIALGQPTPVMAAAKAAAAAAGKKIVVFGGSGYVGSYVDQQLLSQGYQVVSVSRSSAADQAAKITKILGKPLTGSIEYVTLDASTDDLGSVLKDATAVVSCVGVSPGGKNQRAGNGAVNVRLADASQASGSCKRFVYVSVASELANGPAKFLLGDYLKGKAEAEAAVLKDFGSSDSLIVKPAIIAGGPPGELRPPGPPGVKPVAVEDVAKVVVMGALGQKSGVVDGTAALMEINILC